MFTCHFGCIWTLVHFDDSHQKNLLPCRKACNTSNGWHKHRVILQLSVQLACQMQGPRKKKKERKNDEVVELLSKKPFLGKGGNAAKKKLRYYLARTFILQKKWTKTEKNWFKKWVSHLAVRLTSHWYLNKVILNSTRRNPCIRLAAYLRPQWGGELPGRISAPKKKWRSVMRGLMAAFSWSLCIEFVNNW